MRTTGAVLLALLVVAHSVPTEAEAQVRTTVVLDRDGLRYFHLAVGSHFGHPYASVARVRRAVHPDEIPVVFFIAREARVSPNRVVALRTRGWSWWDVSMHLGVHPRSFAALLPRRMGPPYGVAHGYWARRDARAIRYLSDREIVDWVNLHFLASYYRVAPERVIAFRDQGWSYVHVEGVLSGRTAATRANPVQARSARPPLRARGSDVRMKEDPRPAPGRRARERGGGRP